MRTTGLLCALQLVLAGGAVALVAARVRALWFSAALDGQAFVAALRDRLEAGEVGLARRLAKALRPAWAAELAHRGLEGEDAAGSPVELIVDESLSDFSLAASKHLYAIHTLGRMAAPLSFVTAIVEIGLAFHEEAGLLALQKGLVESMAVERALLAIVIGLVSSLFCQLSVRSLRRQGNALMGQLRLTANLLSSYHLRATPHAER